MARLSLNKSQLHRETKALKSFLRFLPSLDLKRRQLLAERKSARDALAETGRTIAALREEVRAELPMLANREVDLRELVVVKGVKLGEENVVGSRLPVLERVKTHTRDYALMGKPQWVDRVADCLRQMLELRVKQDVERKRLELLEVAVLKITQRVNLFDKVLIPRTQRNIKRIQIYLSDMERAAVVQAKIAKRKYAADVL